MKVLELFCGTKSFSNVALELGHEVFTVDFNPKFKPDLVLKSAVPFSVIDGIVKFNPVFIPKLKLLFCE